MTVDPAHPLALIVAVAKNGVIGAGGGLPWSLPEDRRHFERTTHGHAVIMGRRTWDETGRPLEGRRNLVVSRRTDFHPEGVEVFANVDDAVAAALATDPQPFVIGGAEIFRRLFPCVGVMYLTEVDRDAGGDTVFPAWDPAAWREVSHEDHEGFRIRVLTRIRA